MPPSLSELKVKPSFCFAFKIPDDYVPTTLFCKSCEGEKKATFEGSELSLFLSLSSDHAWGLFSSTVWVYTCAVFGKKPTYLFEYRMVILDSTWRLASFESHWVLRTTEFREPQSFENHGVLRTTVPWEPCWFENLSVFFQLDLKKNYKMSKKPYLSTKKP